MLEGDYEGNLKQYESNNGELLIRLVNLCRVLFYFTAAWVQYDPLIDCIILTGNCDVMLVLVPLFLGILDFAMIVWSRKASTKFWNIALIIPIISIAVAINTISPLVFLLSRTIPETIMLSLSIAVLLVSIIEFHGLRQMIHYWTTKPAPTESIDEVRTYEI
ncbi:MAG: hypothetical protein JW779_07455 [Candidatus Thorarchaeota archaeon]|nr:hypothetical protein [Candidatus Thorarchaeota archaeon]